MQFPSWDMYMKAVYSVNLCDVSSQFFLFNVLCQPSVFFRLVLINFQSFVLYSITNDLVCSRVLFFPMLSYIIYHTHWCLCTCVCQCMCTTAVYELRSVGLLSPNDCAVQPSLRKSPHNEIKWITYELYRRFVNVNMDFVSYIANRFKKAFNFPKQWTKVKENSNRGFRHIYFDCYTIFYECWE